MNKNEPFINCWALLAWRTISLLENSLLTNSNISFICFTEKVFYFYDLDVKNIKNSIKASNDNVVTICVVDDFTAESL